MPGPRLGEKLDPASEMLSDWMDASEAVEWVLRCAALAASMLVTIGVGLAIPGAAAAAASGGGEVDVDVIVTAEGWLTLRSRSARQSTLRLAEPAVEPREGEPLALSLSRLPPAAADLTEPSLRLFWACCSVLSAPHRSCRAAASCSLPVQGTAAEVETLRWP